jgi:hypothetical protein
VQLSAFECIIKATNGQKNSLAYKEDNLYHFQFKVVVIASEVAKVAT